MVLFARPQAKCFKCIISYPHEVGAVLPIPGFQKNLYDTERFFSLWLYPPEHAQSLQRAHTPKDTGLAWGGITAQGWLTAQPSLFYLIPCLD